MLLAAACGDGRPPTAPGRTPDVGRVEGRVLDFASSAGVAGAVVRFVDSGDGVGREATADVSGAYAIVLPPGDHGVLIGDAYAGAIVVHLGAVRGDVYVHGGACVARYGAVADAESGRPVAGATVTYAGRTTITGADGWYRIDHPCAGVVLGGTTGVQVSRPGYADAFKVTGRGIGFVQRMDVDLHRAAGGGAS